MGLRLCDDGHEAVSYNHRDWPRGCPVCESQKEIAGWEKEGKKNEEEINNLCDQIHELEETTISTKGPERCEGCEYLSVPSAPSCIRGSGFDYCIDKERGLKQQPTSGSTGQAQEPSPKPPEK